MRRLEHLPCIKRMKIGVVVAQPAGHTLQNPRHRFGVGGGLESRPCGRQSRKLLLKQLGSARQQAGNKILGHGNLLR